MQKITGKPNAPPLADISLNAIEPKIDPRGDNFAIFYR
jgi:hypothetical protein